MRVPVHERQVGVGGIPGARIGGVGGPDAYGAQVGGAVRELGERMARIAEDIEDARTLEAFNAFRRESFEHHEAPDRGLWNTRLGAAAQGVYRDADEWIGGKADEWANKMPSARAARNFRRMAEQHRVQMGERNSRFEADQIKAYRDGEADATIRLGLDQINEAWADDAAVASIREGMTDALELKTRGMGPEARRAALEEMEGQIAMTRLSRMIQADPVAAKAWFKENRASFTGEGAARAEDAVEKAVQIYETQTMADELAVRFPVAVEDRGIEWIRANFSGPEEERLVTAYRQRMNEQGIAEMRARRAEAEQAARARDARALQNRKAVERRLFQTMPEAMDLSEEELDVMVMRAMGTTDEDYRATVAAASAAVVEGRLSERDVDALWNRGLIDGAVRDQLKGRVKALGEAQKTWFRTEKKDLDTELSVLETAGLLPELSYEAQETFAIRAAQLDPKDPKYREELFRVKKEVLISAIDASGERLEGRFWGRTPMGSRRDIILDSTFSDRGISPFPELPPVTPTELGLGTREDSAAVNAHISAGAAANVGKPYVAGGKSAKGKGFDCSGLVAHEMGGAMRARNAELGYEAYSKEAIAAVNGASADIIENVSAKTGFLKEAPTVSDLRPGMVVGLDASGGAGGRGFRGIDHVALVVMDDDGTMKIYESNAKQGTVKTDAGKWLARYRDAGKPTFLVDPSLMMQKPPLRGIGGLFGDPSDQGMGG
ncbi:MAG: hypothetical protein IJR14_07990 [Synergistaceae bacterium]|nr:hypothetical protein [Synergistaceae bacterium]